MRPWVGFLRELCQVGLSGGHLSTHPQLGAVATRDHSWRSTAALSKFRGQGTNSINITVPVILLDFPHLQVGLQSGELTKKPGISHTHTLTRGFPQMQIIDSDSNGPQLDRENPSLLVRNKLFGAPNQEISPFESQRVMLEVDARSQMLSIFKYPTHCKIFKYIPILSQRKSICLLDLNLMFLVSAFQKKYHYIILYHITSNYTFFIKSRNISQ